MWWCLATLLCNCTQTGARFRLGPDTPDSLDPREAGSDWSVLITLVASEQSLSLLFEKDSLRGVEVWVTGYAYQLNHLEGLGQHLTSASRVCSVTFFSPQCAKISPMTKDQKVNYKHKRTKISYRKQLIRWTKQNWWTCPSIILDL